MRFFIVLLAVFAANAAAAQQPDRSAAQAACRPDYQKYCAGVPRGGGRIAACLKANLNRLSPDCRAHVERNSVPTRRD